MFGLKGFSRADNGSGVFAFAVDARQGRPYMTAVIQRYQMRILIYLLAMLTGFSAAEAARPVLAAPTLVGVKADAAYAAAAVKVSSQTYITPPYEFQAFTSQLALVESFAPCSVICLTTPVLRHDTNRS